MTSCESEMERFFRSFERVSAGEDVPAMVAQFADVFLAAGPQGAKAVSAAEFAQVLPKRKQLFDSLGCVATELVQLEELRLDARYTMAKTRWRMTFVQSGREAQEVLADSVYLVDRGAEEPKIILYLANQDILAVLKERGIMAG